MASIESSTEAAQGTPPSPSFPSLMSRFERGSVIRFAVCTATLWLMVLLLTLVVVVGVYTSQANQLLVVSCVSVISIALVVASCKLNSIAGLHKMEEDMAAKADSPPKYEDVLHSEAPPPSYYTVVSEAASTTTPAATRSKLEPQPVKVLATPGPRRSPAFRRWLGRPGILQTLVSPSMFRAPRGASPPTSPQSVKSKRSLALRRSSSTPSLAGLDIHPSMARSPSTPSLCDGCGWF